MVPPFSQDVTLHEAFVDSVVSAHHGGRWADGPGLAECTGVRLSSSPCPGLHVQPIEQIWLILTGRRRWVQTETIRRSKGTAVQLGWEAPPEAIRRNLRAMREQGL